MNIGISGLSTDHGDIGLLAQKIEELGFESIWLPEHPVIPVNHDTKYAGTPDGSVPESMSHQVNPFSALARASATTRTLKFGTAVCLVTEHNPLDLAKQISTLDFCSDGRFFFGIGTGWFREESEIMGADFDHRWTQAREHVLAMKELWTQDAAGFTADMLTSRRSAAIRNPLRRLIRQCYLVVMPDVFSTGWSRGVTGGCPS